MIIRAITFRAWFNANLRDSASDIAGQGADCGYYDMTYTADAVRLFDRFADEIWDMAVEDASEYGCKSVLEFVAGFRRADMADSPDGLKNLMVWYAAEKIANEMVAERESVA